MYARRVLTVAFEWVPIAISLKNPINHVFIHGKWSTDFVVVLIDNRISGRPVRPD